MDMYREVTRSGQYMTRKRAAFPALRPMPGGIQRPHQRQNQHQAQSHQQNPQHPKQQRQQIQQPQGTGHFSKHQVKGALFKAQSRNSRSHPNLLSLSGHEPTLSSSKPQFQSQIDIQTSNTKLPAIYHARTNSQPEYSERVQQGLTAHARSTHNLIMLSNSESATQNSGSNNVYSDPIYALPVKPFLSSQDVRVNGLMVKSNMGREDFYGQTITGRPRTIKNGGSSQPNIAHLARASNSDKAQPGTTNILRNGRTNDLLHRQYSNPQLPTRNYQESIAASRNSYSQSNCAIAPSKLRVFVGDIIDPDQINSSKNNLVSSIKVSSVHGPVPPKPPRLMATLKRPAPSLPQPNNNLGEAPAKPPRLAIKNGPRARRGKPVQRAPSRLYRTIGGPTRSFNKNQCVGPEFVVRANQPPKILSVGDVKASNSGRIVVILLTGQRIEVTCDPQKITAGELFQAIVQAESLDENFTLGLAALLAGDFAMLPPETKLNKVAPPGWLNSGKNKGTLGLPTSFMLYLRLRFFLPSLRGTRSWISKHLLYLQIRRCILEQQLVCPLAQLINLTGFALQAEFGNYNANEHGRGDYFLLEHYIPESLILNPDANLQKSQLPGGPEALRARLHQAHRDRRGLDANNAEEMFIIHAQALPDYGSHYYIATADNKELGKIMERLKKCNSNRPPSATTDGGMYACTENIYQLDAPSDCHVYGKIEFDRINSCDKIQRRIYTDEERLRASTNATNANEDIYAVPTSASVVNLVETNNNSNSNKLNKSKKSESNVWLAIHAQGLKLFERGGRPRDRNELARLQWRDIQTLSYSKNSLVVYTRFNGKRCKFKLRMDHKKSYYAFKLTSLHHQFFLKLRSEVTSLHGLAKDFGVPLMVEPTSPPLKLVPDPSKPKKTIVNNGKTVPNSKYPMQLEEYQNKENENPQKVVTPLPKSEDMDAEPVCYTPEEDALYAQVNARLEPEGASRDTEDESDRVLASRNGHIDDVLKSQRAAEEQKIYSYPNRVLPSDKEALYSTPKPIDANDPDRTNNAVKHPEELYAAINKTGHNKKRNDYPVPDEVWDVAGSKKNLHKVKTSSLPNYGTPKQNTGFRTPSLPRRLGVKMGTRAIYSTVVQRDSDLTDDLESLSVKSDTASSIQSASAHSNDSPMPEAYVLNAEIRTDDDTFRIGNDDTMSASLLARLEELSFAEERILHTIQLERGHGGSIGLQVTEGNDGGVYVQAVSVGGSADMAGNVNKGDKIVAINGQSLLNLRYEEALTMLQSSSATVELVLSQITSNRNGNLQRERLQEQTENNYLQNLRFEISSEAETSSMTTKWLSQRATDVASVQNTSSAYSSAASSSMGNHNTNNMFLKDADTNALNSASMLLSLSDFDVSRTSRQVFI
ncbi:uncharacterized protein [Venturia canescens]|nr:uncharacterized protein LOC122408170 isoform X2 [Venturia canescens]